MERGKGKRCFERWVEAGKILVGTKAGAGAGPGAGAGAGSLLGPGAGLGAGLDLWIAQILCMYGAEPVTSHFNKPLTTICVSTCKLFNAFAKKLRKMQGCLMACKCLNACHR
jgi:hypothetical protein